MRIVVISETVGSAFGQERVVRDSARLLREAGNDVHFLAAHQNGPCESHAVHLLPEIFRLHSLSRFPAASRAVRSVLRTLTSIAPDVVHLTDQLDARLTTAIATRFSTVITAHTVALTCPASGRFIRGDSVCTVRSGWGCLSKHADYGCLSHFKSPLHRLHAVYESMRKRQSVRDHVKAVLAISRYVERVLLDDGWPRESVRYVPNPVTVDETVEPDASAPENLIVCAARLVPMKGIERLLRAVAQLKALPWTVWLCGEGPSREALERETHELGIAARVRFLGRTDFARTQAIVAAARVVVQPNLGPEGFGLTVAEAGALGVPVVTFDVPALNEVVIAGQTGLVASARDDDALRHCIERLLRDAELARRLGSTARNSIRERYGAKAHLDATLAVYESVTGLLAARGVTPRPAGLRR